MINFDFSTYLSPLTWRYGSDEMRRIFSEKHKYELWRKIWVALAEAQHQVGLVNKEELDDLKKNERNIDIEKIFEYEKDTKHDVVAAIKEFAEKAKIGGGKIHLGATSMDVVDNADMVKIQEALEIIEKKVITILNLLANKIEEYADYPCLGYTHLQPAEPTTVGYRLAFYAQDLLTAYEFIQFAKKTIKGKGMKGAVGTAASYKELLKDLPAQAGKTISVDQLENKVMKSLGIDAALISGQVYPRLFDFIVLNGLVTVTSALAKFAGDLRILQSPLYGEWSEPFGKKQVGSSAMPFKKNPISSENICSLARFVATLPQVASENASLSYLERTLDDSANKRIVIAEAFLTTDQILITAEKIISGLVINRDRISFNLRQYASFAASESIILEAVKNGADRQEMHEVLRINSMIAWTDIQNGKKNPMMQLLLNDKLVSKYLNKNQLEKLMEVENHIGDVPERAKKLVKIIRVIPA
ncbi:MAG: Adenylosuccinate lyase [Candidatus Roizmanbacteria bacterium GW2011_GWA2_33_33]|uniref:Adenylosuccinate lyase n=2 Tax=Candidatus Roizmaniibacteriota TaxID=1752723 RepID=A0A0G0AX46_9BACT|nr:MAG: Adenylosuccinate lyase [Candidatus Roizmanbacteria bacterium GW2011_GWA2_33_33]KKP61594.1 MAG: Adenylosuccinate lyase [Candidatus Roizmanbacteria bacterium GW2011_GWC2_34_23]